MFKNIYKAAIMASSLALSAKASDDMNKTMEQLCLENGFRSEMHTLVTDDGYVLTLYRIPGKFTDDMSVKKPAVLMVHAQDCDMLEWFWNEPSKANGFILANAGFDVWMGNNRGSKYSKGHLTLSTKDHAFWDYYQEDMAKHDLPAFIDFVTEKTAQPKISYIGHSEGTTQMFIGASLNPSYFKEKINLYIALAPVASTANIPNKWIRIAAKMIKVLEYIIVGKLNYYNWFAPMPVVTDAVGTFCSIIPGVCDWFIKHLFNHEGVDEGKRFPMFISNEPSGQSYRTFVYYAQMINSGKTELYDYGRIKNKEIYGTFETPLVPLQNIEIPVALFSGSLDGLADPTDVANLSATLGDKVVFQKEYLLDHFSFAIAKDMTWFSTDAVNLLKEYNSMYFQ